MKYAVYGAGPTGKAAVRLIREMNSEVVLLVDSDEKKWGTEAEGCKICSPDRLPELRDDYDQILIASAYYKDIKNRLNSLGLEHEEIAIFE
jgi:FlaA1/EpsC-like NDP-sugar epimerase